MSVPQQLVGEGRTAQIYAWGDGQVLKLFRAEFPADSARHEAQIAAVVGQVCLVAPAMRGTVEIDEGGRRRTGIVYERVSGPTMVQVITRRPWLMPGLTRQFAQLHAAIHSIRDPILANLPSLAEYTRRDVQRGPVSDAVKGRALAALDALPPGDSLCHRDFHPDQIIVSARGLVVLDWMTAAVGNPVADVARSSLILSARGLPPHFPPVQGIIIQAMRGAMHRLYLRRYGQVRPFDAAELAGWRAVLAIGRLNEHVPGEEAHLRRLIERTFGTA